MIVMSGIDRLEQEAMAQLDELLEGVRLLRARSAYDDCSDLPDESRALVARLQAALDRFAIGNDSYRREADAVRGQPTHVRLSELYGIACALRDDMSKGWVRGFAELVRAETLADLLEVATELLGKGYKDAGAMTAGTALELHLRHLAGKYGVPLRDAKGGHKSADLLAAELRSAGAFGALEQKRITAWLGLRNSAAHGAYG